MPRNKKYVLKKKRGFPWVKLLFTLAVVLGGFLVYLDAKIMHRFNGAKWTLPATVYARALEVYEGKSIAKEDFIKELKGAGYRLSSTGMPGTYQVSGSSISIATRPFTFWDKKQPAFTVNIGVADHRVSSLEGLPTEMRGSFRLEPVKIGSIHPKQHEERIVVSYSEIPENLIEALLATEDRDFFRHHGVSFKGIARAAVSNFRHGEITQGASTITQQLVKNLFLSNERTFHRKIEEVIMAFLLEFRASKEEILETYVNEVFVAQDGSRAIHGFALASEFFFSKPLNQLTDAQMAMLVGMMKGPSYYNPLRHPVRATDRRNLVLTLMNQQGYLSDSDFQRAQAETLRLMVRPDPGSNKSYAAYVQLVREQLLRDYSQSDLQTQGLNIFTNLEPSVQARAQTVLNQGLKKLERRFGKVLAETNGAIIVANHNTGDVEAIVGGKDFRPGSFNRALYAKRPIGSLAKPAVYLTAIEKGYRLSNLISDEPVSLELNGNLWEPKNYDKKSHHLSNIFPTPASNAEVDIPLYLAMAKSYNQATVRLGLDVGVGPVVKTFEKLGVTADIPKVPALFLGALELTPIETLQFFTTFAANGFYAPLKAIREVTNSEGEALKRYKIKLEKRFDLVNMHLINFALQTVMHEGTGRSAKKSFPKNMMIAGKTGTTNDLRDNWFAGFTTDRTAVVWLGRDDNKPLPMSGALGALPLWTDLMSAYPSVMGRPPVPDDIDYYWVDVAQGELTEDGCPNAVFIPYKLDTQPTQHSACYSQRQSDYWFKRWFQ
ncbi:MAG: penicillin-binding protein 1B [Cellvibrionales bacterium]|nr:penicillin-binding protein 1B [Cellvibrionales bacterium]